MCAEHKTTPPKPKPDSVKEGERAELTKMKLSCICIELCQLCPHTQFNIQQCVHASLCTTMCRCVRYHSHSEYENVCVYIHFYLIFVAFIFISSFSFHTFRLLFYLQHYHSKWLATCKYITIINICKKNVNAHATANREG